jgi:hypothetical protein
VSHLCLNEIKISARPFGIFKAMPEQAGKVGGVYASIDAGDGVRNARPPECLSIDAMPCVRERAREAEELRKKTIGFLLSYEREQIPANVFLQHSRVKPWLMEIAGPTLIVDVAAAQRGKLNGPYARPLGGTASRTRCCSKSTRKSRGLPVRSEILIGTVTTQQAAVRRAIDRPRVEPCSSEIRRPSIPVLDEARWAIRIAVVRREDRRRRGDH